MVKLLCKIADNEPLNELRKFETINQDLYDMAEAHLIKVASFKPVTFQLTEKGLEFYKDFSIWGRSFCLLRPDVEEIFADWLKKQGMKGEKR